MFDEAVTAAGNGAIAAPALYLAWRCLVRARAVSAPTSRWALRGMAVLLAGVGLRIGMWNPPIWLAPEGARYHPFFFEIRDEYTLISAALFVIGASLTSSALSLEDEWWSGFAKGAAAAIIGAVGSAMLVYYP